MRWFIKILLTGIICFFVQPHTPWWSLAIIVLTLNIIIPENALLSFSSGLVSIGLLWFYTSYQIDQNSAYLLSKKMAMIFHLPPEIQLTYVTCIVGGIIGGMWALVGNKFIRLFKTPKKKRIQY